MSKHTRKFLAAGAATIGLALASSPAFAYESMSSGAKSCPSPIKAESTVTSTGYTLHSHVQSGITRSKADANGGYSWHRVWTSVQSVHVSADAISSGSIGCDW
jgi:hypothetical protein